MPANDERTSWAKNFSLAFLIINLIDLNQPEAGPGNDDGSCRIRPAGYPDVSNTPEKLKESKFPWFYCWTQAVAPFVVRVDSGHASGPLGGDGGTTYYLW